MKLVLNKPCPAKQWDALQGAGSERYCGDCDKHVVDLSSMEASEARRFMWANPEACVRFRTDAEGHVATRADRRRGLLRGRLMRHAATAALGGAMTASPAMASSALAEETSEQSFAQRAVTWLRSWVEARPDPVEAPSCEQNVEERPLSSVEVIPPTVAEVSAEEAPSQPPVAEAVAKPVVPEKAVPAPVKPVPHGEYMGGAALQYFD